MGVYIAPTDRPHATSVEVRCWGQTPDLLFPNQSEADSHVAAHMAVCPDCRAYQGPIVEDVYDSPEASMTASRLETILHHLGLTGLDVWGETVDPDILLAAHTASAGSPVDGLEPIISIARWAKEHNTTVSWG